MGRNHQYSNPGLITNLKYNRQGMVNQSWQLKVISRIKVMGGQIVDFGNFHWVPGDRLETPATMFASKLKR